LPKASGVDQPDQQRESASGTVPARIEEGPRTDSPFVRLIGGILKHGAAMGVFRRDSDPFDLYVSIAALSFFYSPTPGRYRRFSADRLAAMPRAESANATTSKIILDAIRAWAQPLR
jgi:hypothetical protein